MSIFKDSWFIIKISKQEKNFLYTIFSQKFGKIIAQKKISKKEKNIDLGFLINYEIKVSEKNNISKIQNIKIINEFKTDNKSFSQINAYLIMLNIVLKQSPFWIENDNIFEIINIINKYQKNDLEIKILLASLKIINIFWELNIQNNNQIIEKILKFISKNHFKKIIKLSWINDDIKKELQKIL